MRSHVVSGLTKTLPITLAELRKVTGAAKIMLGFDRGGAYASVFAHCRDHDVDWITCRRSSLAPVTAPPSRHWRADADGRTESITLADETVTIEGYGQARQLTLYDNDQPMLQADRRIDRRVLDPLELGQTDLTAPQAPRASRSSRGLRRLPTTSVRAAITAPTYALASGA